MFEVDSVRTALYENAAQPMEAWMALNSRIHFPYAGGQTFRQRSLIILLTEIDDEIDDV